MRKKRLDRTLLAGSITAFLVMAVSFLLMPVESVRMLAGGLFWMGLLTGLILQVILEIRRTSFLARYHIRSPRKWKDRIGLLTFGANRAAITADVALTISLVCLALIYWLTRGMSYLCFIFLAITAFLLCMHCILNGRIYFFVVNRTEIQREVEKKNVRKIGKERDLNV